MHVRKLLVPLSGRFAPSDSESLDVPALETSVGLARHLGARIEVLCVTGPAGPQATGWISWVPDYGMEAVLSAMEKQGEVRRKRARKSYEAIVTPECAAGRVEAAFVENPGEIGAVVGAAGRLSDVLVLASSESRWEQPFRPILDAALRRTGRPVFVAPQKAPKTFGSHIAIAWNDTVEAARALVGAMPFLQCASKVTVITCHEIGEASKRADPEKLVAYLGLHNVKAQVQTLSSKHRDVPRNIIETSLSEGADILALGGVIHTRAQSLVYGSLTEEVLKSPRLSALVVP